MSVPKVFYDAFQIPVFPLCTPVLPVVKKFKTLNHEKAGENRENPPVKTN